MAERLKGLLDRANSVLGGLLGDFPQGFNAGAVAGVAGYPGDIAYMLDTAGRALTGQHTQPSAQDFPGTTEYLAAKAGYPVPQSFSGQLGAAVGGILTPGPGDLAKFAPVLSAIPFWHGSPHKYDAVDLSKIGTGEGAQAYGYGLYLAESPDVAKSYQTALAADRGFSFDGKSGLTRAEVQDMVNAKYGSGYLDGVLRPSGVADSFIDDMVTGLNRVDGSYPRQYKPGSERAKVYDELRGKISHTDPGSLYKVDIPDEDVARFLDWDKPLSEQAHVMDLINKQEAQRTQSVLDRRLQTLANVGEDAPNAPILKKQIEILREEVANPQSGVGSMTGGEYYNYLRRRDIQPSEQANMFRNAGIPGIRYLDGGSRGAGTGTSNFVVFDPELIRILERNGVATGAKPWQPGEWEGLLSGAKAAPEMYRGINGVFDPSYQNAIEWWSTKPELAKEYGETMLTRTGVPSNPVDLGFRDLNTEVKMSDVTDRVKRAITDRFNSGQIDRSVAMELFDKADSISANGFNRAHKWLSDTPELARILSDAGYDSIGHIERGTQTYGLLKAK